MDLQLFYKLLKGDWVETEDGKIGVIVHFGRWNGKRWVKSSRKRADGVYVWNQGWEGYVHRSQLRRYLPAPSFGYSYKSRAKGGVR